MDQGKIKNCKCKWVDYLSEVSWRCISIEQRSGAIISYVPRSGQRYYDSRDGQSTVMKQQHNEA